MKLEDGLCKTEMLIIDYFVQERARHTDTPTATAATSTSIASAESFFRCKQPDRKLGRDSFDN